MAFWNRRAKLTEEPVDPESRRLSRREEDEQRFAAYVRHAQELPLLSDQELDHWIATGETTRIGGGIGQSFWASQIDTQFVIRLRRTLHHKLTTGTREDESVHQV